MSKPAKKPKPFQRFVKISKTSKVTKGAHVAFIDLLNRDETGAALMFAAKDLGRSDWDKHGDIANACRLLGYDDWRSPDDMEAQAFIDRKRPYPMCRTELYTGEIGWAWTSTPHPSGSSYAFNVNLDGGSVTYSYRDYDGLVLACRRVSPRQLSALGL